MTVLEAIRNEVERDLLRWAAQPEVEDEREVVLSVHVVRSPSLEANGFRYQRCGGGRRIIRKQGRAE